MNYPHPIIAREGWPYIGGLLVAALLASWAAAATGHGALTASAAVLWLLLVFVVQFFRDPPRPVPADPLAVLSPADGRVVKVEKAHDPYAGRDAILISVFMNVFNVHSNRSSVDGIIRKVEYFKGSFVNADLDKASTENERNAVVIDASGRTVTLVQVAGLIARRILCYVKDGATLRRGQRYGFIRFGSRVDVYLPTDAMPKVGPGDKVSATTTVLAVYRS